MPAGWRPDLFTRGFKYLFLAQQATAEHQGDVWANCITSLPEGERPKTAAYPTLDDPFAQPTSKGIESILQEAGVETVYRKTYPADTNNFDPIASQIKAAEPELVVAGNQFEDGVGMCGRCARSASRPTGCTRPARPPSAPSTRDGIGEENTEGVFYAVSHSEEATTPGNEEFVAKYKEMFGGERGARGRRRRVRVGPDPAGGRGGEQDGRAPGPAQAGRLAARRTRSRRSSAR